VYIIGINVQHMVQFIAVEELLKLRNDVLRGGMLILDECRFPTDSIAGAFHLGYYLGGQLVSIASLSPQPYGAFTGLGYQLRGMATAENYRGRGIGNQLLNFAIVFLRGQKANYLWCNARKKALKFYQDSGFEVISAEFEVPAIGPHYVMYLKIQ
jgi:predicted GNAT family N-acyltransferase